MLERETILAERYEARRRREENRKVNMFAYPFMFLHICYMRPEQLNEEIRREKAAVKGVEITRCARPCDIVFKFVK